MNFLFIRYPPRTFCDIGWHRDYCPSNLTTKIISLVVWEFLSKLINQYRQFFCFLPSFKILKLISLFHYLNIKTLATNH